MNDKFKAYVITNLVNGKKYVGITEQPLNLRWSQHLCAAKKTRKCGRIQYAIEKYGRENFTIEHVACSTSRPKLKELEKLLILQEGTFTPHGGYNATEGGDSLSEESRAKISIKNRARVLPPEWYEKNKNALRYFSPEARAAIGAPWRGKKKLPEHIQAIVAKTTGQKRNPLTRAKIAEKARARYPQMYLFSAEEEMICGKTLTRRTS